MNEMLEVGKIVVFKYNGKTRQVKLEKVSDKLVTGWDYQADLPVGGYRSFTVDKMECVQRL